jgi:hypothetical protein
VAVWSLLVLDRTVLWAADCSMGDSSGTSPRVRSTNATILDLLSEGASRSTTFCSLIDVINGSHDIVYVEYGYCNFGRVNGCLLPYIVLSRTERYLRVQVTPDKNRLSHDQRLAIIAHELQHAIEVIQHPEVVDLTTMEKMYRKIGMPLGDGMTVYETSAARAAGDSVLTELLARRSYR